MLMLLADDRGIVGGAVLDFLPEVDAAGALIARAVFAYAKGGVLFLPSVPRLWHESHFALHADGSSTYAAVAAAITRGGTFPAIVGADDEGNRGNPLQYFSVHGALVCLLVGIGRIPVSSPYLYQNLSQTLIV